MAEKEREESLVYNLLSKDEKLKNGIHNESIVDIVDSILLMAINYGASDIHFEQNQNDLRIRYRIDGILYDQTAIKKELGAAILSRLKILSNLDIAEKRVPQDGKFRVRICKKSENIPNDNNLIDMRISTFPTIYGEKLVMRILDKSQNNIELNKLGMDEFTLSEFYKLIDRPYGFFLITGPTGSGKTTTLYSILSHLNDGEKNIVTMEDPVEYNLDGIVQSQINEKAGFNFHKGLRSILRQDPDVIMIGEIRDKETAKIAIEAALTGHLVFSTLHTNDTVSAVTRLIDMGVDSFLINAALSGVLSQRLVRSLCNSCKKEDLITEQEENNLKNININNFKLNKINRPCGCNNCFDLGYKGRIGIFELLKIDDEIRDLISAKNSTKQIKDFLIKKNMKFIEDDALKKVDDGQTSFEEFFKAIIH
ncbi:GspE/PulE family protein [Candidatus Dependentiae bacterium]|nr:GspE/PulE family protein [Candidatus Dependentiae bacterium]MBU4387642.1 GspE/PulE family protein [Candidatus Dependentiae bacterium]MCG2756354.1 GspE/PulE family protein [Candidatus Dependentiae bacterium]